MKGRDNRLATKAHKIQDPVSPFARIEAKLVLQAHDVARAVVGNFRGFGIGVWPFVIDDVDHTGIVVVDHTCLQNRRHGTDRVARREVDRVCGILREGGEPALFGRVGRYKQRANDIHSALSEKESCENSPGGHLWSRADASSRTCLSGLA